MKLPISWEQPDWHLWWTFEGFFLPPRILIPSFGKAPNIEGLPYPVPVCGIPDRDPVWPGPAKQSSESLQPQWLIEEGPDNQHDSMFLVGFQTWDSSGPDWPNQYESRDSHRSCKEESLFPLHLKLWGCESVDNNTHEGRAWQKVRNGAKTESGIKRQRDRNWILRISLDLLDQALPEADDIYRLTFHLCEPVNFPFT